MDHFESDYNDKQFEARKKDLLEQFPFEVVIKYMVSPLQLKLQTSNTTQLTDTELNEYLCSLGKIHQLLLSLKGVTSTQMFHSGSTGFGIFEETLLNLVRDVCFPMLYSLHLLPESDKSNSEKGRALALICNVILASTEHFDGRVLMVVLTQLFMPLLSNCGVEPNGCLLYSYRDDAYHRFLSEPLNNFLSLEILGSLLNHEHLFRDYLNLIGQISCNVNNDISHIFKAVTSASTDDAAFSKAFTVTAKLFPHIPQPLRRDCEAELWQQYTRPLHLTSDGEVDKESLWKSLFVFYCLKNYFFPLEESKKSELSSRLCSDNFWRILQAGLVSADPSHRKISMYLLKRLVDTCNKNSCEFGASAADVTKRSKENFLTENLTVPAGDGQAPLFWWSSPSTKQLTAVWENFFLLIETLEEKQVHVIKPILPRMQKLVDATTVSVEGVSLLHSSWLITIITRCFHHDSHYMSRWGALTLLSLDLLKVPLISHKQLKFLSNDLLMYLQENKLYSRYEGTELGKSSPIGEALRSFFANLFCALSKEQKVEYLRNLLQIVCDNSWGSIPLVFVFQGLAHIPPEPVLNHQLLQLVRQLLQSCFAFHEMVTRGAIQCFICQFLINLVDLEETGLSEFFSTLSPLYREESLQRGTTLWNSVVDWLNSAAVKEKWSENEVLSLSKQYLQEDKEGENGTLVVEGYKVVSLARMLLLFADATERNTEAIAEGGVMKILLGTPLGLIMGEVSDTVTDIRSRAYINTGKVDKCLCLLYSLVLEAGKLQDKVVDSLLKKYLAVPFKDVSYYIRNRLSNDLLRADDIGEIEFYTAVLVCLGRFSDSVHAELLDLLAFVGKVFSLSVQPNAHTQHQVDILNMSAMKTLAAVLEILDTYSQSDSKCVAEIVQKMALLPRLSQIPLPFTKKNCSQENVSNAQVGSIVSSFISSKWECQKFMFRQAAGGSLKFDMVDILDQAMEDLGLGSGSSDVAVFQALEVVMTELLSVADPNNVVKLMELGWCNVLEEKKNVLFWRKLRALLPLFLHQAVLRQSPDSVIGQGLDKFLEKTCELGYDKTGVMFIVFDHLCQHSLKGDTDRQMAMRVVPLLVDGCFSGAMHKKGERLWLDVCAYIESLGDSCSVNQIMTSMSRNDMFTRIIILNWLSELRPDVPADRNFALTLITSLRAKYLDLAAQTTYKQFSNSLSHRHKHRMVLVFLLLADFIKEDTCQDYIAKLWHALEIECHPSVRQNLEWLVILLISRFPHNVSSVWDVFKLYDNKRSVCLCSLFLIISHLGPKLPANLQSQYFTQAFSATLPWTMAHHYNTRIFAQTTVVRLWEQCQSLQLKDVIAQFFMVESSINFIFSNGNASATVSKLLSNYMYAAFDAVRDYSMETIFYTLPRLACLADDEWILPKYFIQGNNSWAKGDNHLLPLRNSSPLLAQCKEGPWRTKAQAENDDDIVESADGDVQKKIMPWRQMSPDQETEAELVMQRQKRAEGGLVLVTSLIDKIPNLGGLCRTSEIFGVSEFVIGNLTYVEDRMFQNLSVSAQKWITITEVLRPRLSEFLEEKRVQGYTLVGVEQTANSVCLQEYQFPKKTLLLLGNEREGIPVDIIQNLDVCVEIPQQGVIRSLNVHVCGALIVWEYTRQHMKNMKA